MRGWILLCGVLCPSDHLISHILGCYRVKTAEMTFVPTAHMKNPNKNNSAALRSVLKRKKKLKKVETLLQRVVKQPDAHWYTFQWSCQGLIPHQVHKHDIVKTIHTNTLTNRFEQALLVFNHFNLKKKKVFFSRLKNRRHIFKAENVFWSGTHLFYTSKSYRYNKT